MNAVAECPFKSVKQREMPVQPHAHQFLARTMIDDGSYIEDCACGYRQRVRKNKRGLVLQTYDDAMAQDGTSLANSIFFRLPDGNFVDRWNHVP